MKLAFSTLGCPDFNWTDIYSMAKDLGFDGIEIRGLGNEIFAVKAQPFTEADTADHQKTLGTASRNPLPFFWLLPEFADKAEENIKKLCNIFHWPPSLARPMSVF